MAADYRTVRDELAAYDAGLPEKLELVCLNKCDALNEALITARRGELAAAAQRPVHVISGIAGQGLPLLLRELVEAMDAAAPEAEAEAEADADMGADTEAAAKAAGWQP